VNYKKPGATKNSDDVYVDSTEGESDEDTPKCYQVANSNSTRKPLLVKGKNTSSVDFSEDDHIYEMEPYEEENSTDNGSVYENTDFPPRHGTGRKGSSPAVLSGLERGINKSPSVGGRPHSISAMLEPKRKRHSPDDYEDPDAVLEGLEDVDYVDMDVSTHNTYIDPEDLRRDSSCSSVTASSGSFTSSKRPDSTSSIPGQSKHAGKRLGAFLYHNSEPVNDTNIYMTNRGL
jgi:hypothetical protein